MGSASPLFVAIYTHPALTDILTIGHIPLPLLVFIFNLTVGFVNFNSTAFVDGMNPPVILSVTVHVVNEIHLWYRPTMQL